MEMMPSDGCGGVEGPPRWRANARAVWTSRARGSTQIGTTPSPRFRAMVRAGDEVETEVAL